MAVRKVVKDLKTLLKDLEGAVKDPKFLQRGRDISNFSLRPREVWANWLICAVLQKIHGTEDITFTDGPESDDGVIVDKGTGGSTITEHVSALDVPSKGPLLKGEARIIARIDHKIKRGSDYARGKFLVVFFDGLGKWYRSKVREAINGRHYFKGVYLVGLLKIENGSYSYSVTELQETDSISFKVQINPDFTDWTVAFLR